MNQFLRISVRTFYYTMGVIWGSLKDVSDDKVYLLDD